jgi:hypothetical protein
VASLGDRSGVCGRRLVTALAAASAAAWLGVALGGCISTQQKATWLHVEDARIIAGQRPTVVTRAGDQIQVSGVTLLRAQGQLAIAVDLRNRTDHAVNDVPISVGLGSRSGRRVYLNRGSNLDYFKSHVAVIPARGASTWVFTGPGRPGLRGRPFAIAGSESDPPVTVVRSIPALRIRETAASPPSGSGTVQVTVTNLSSIPQVAVPVYAFAGDGGRYSAAGTATVASLGTGQTTTARVELVGHEHGTQLQLEALPTLF